MEKDDKIVVVIKKSHSCKNCPLQVDPEKCRLAWNAHSSEFCRSHNVQLFQTQTEENLNDAGP